MGVASFVPDSQQCLASLGLAQHTRDKEAKAASARKLVGMQREGEADKNGGQRHF